MVLIILVTCVQFWVYARLKLQILWQYNLEAV
jgi:hypothetical protein